MFADLFADLQPVHYAESPVPDGSVDPAQGPLCVGNFRPELGGYLAAIVRPTYDPPAQAKVYFQAGHGDYATGSFYRLFMSTAYACPCAVIRHNAVNAAYLQAYELTSWSAYDDWCMVMAWGDRAGSRWAGLWINGYESELNKGISGSFHPLTDPTDQIDVTGQSCWLPLVAAGSTPISPRRAQLLSMAMKERRG